MASPGSRPDLAPRESGPLSRHVRRTLQQKIGDRLIPDGLQVQERTAQIRDQAVEAAGVELESEIAAYPDGKGVYRVRHPVHGPCVLKTVCATCSPNEGLAARARLELLRDAPPGLFPTILETGGHWSLEELVEGWSFGTWAERGFRRDTFARFLRQLRDWSLRTGRGPSAGRLREWQVREICAAYLAKSLYQLRYFSVVQNLSSFRALIAARGPLRERIERLDEAASRVAIPAGLMCGDMYTGNLVVGREDESVVVVDYETIGPGHWGFDAAYLLSTVARSFQRPDALRSMREEAGALLTEDGTEVGEFFALFESILTAIGTAVFQSHQRG